MTECQIRKRFSSGRPVILLVLFVLAVFLVASISALATGGLLPSGTPGVPVASATSKIFQSLIRGGDPPTPAVQTLTAVPPAATATATVPTFTPTPPRGVGVTLLVDGDARSGCASGDVAVASLVGQFPGNTPMLNVGDDTDNGAYSEYTSCFDTVWGKFKSQLFPAPGNHEYQTAGAAGYLQYYRARAHYPPGYYSFDIGAWHIISLNSIIDTSDTSAQVAWLKNDLATHPNRCTLAYWHYPLYSSGGHGDNVAVLPMYRALYDAHADVIINGHDHDYERFAPQNPSGQPDPAYGLTEFVVGTMGAPHSSMSTRKANSLVFDNAAWGLMQMTLYPSGYDWKFIPIAGSTLTDSGSADCH